MTPRLATPALRAVFSTTAGAPSAPGQLMLAETLAWTAIVALAYFAGGKLGMALFPYEKDIAVLWPSPAIALAALIILGPRMLPAVFLGCALVDMTTQATMREVAQSATAATLYCLAAWLFLRRITPIDPGLRRMQDVIRFLLFGVGIVFVLKGLLALGLLALKHGHIPGDMILPLWVSALAAGVGVLVIAPAVLTLHALRHEAIGADRRIEAVTLGVVAVALTILIFFTSVVPEPFAMHLQYVLFPVVFWAGARFGPREVSLVLFVTGVIAVMCTANGSGPFAESAVLDALASSYLFIFVLGGTGLMFAAGLRQRADSDRLARASGERFRLLIERMNEGFIVQDSHGSLTYISDRFCELTGYAREDLLGRRMEEIVAGEQRAAFNARTNAPDTGLRAPYEVTLLRPDGGRIEAQISSRALHDESGTPSRTSFALVTDVTARRQAEAALRESEAKYRLLVENQSDLVLKIRRDGIVTFASPSIRQILGIPADEVVNGPLTLDIQEEDRTASAAAWRAVWSAPYTARFENRVQTPHGWRWLAWSVAAIAEDPAEGEVSAAVATARDITERRRAEEQARQHLQQLAHVARVSSMGEMASAIAHEINQPLTAIANYADACVRMLGSGLASNAELLEAMTRVAAQAQRAGEIVRKMRSFVRGEESQVNPVAVNFVAREVFRLAAPEARESGVELELRTDERLGAVLADSIQIQQVLLNLVRNAVEAIHSSNGSERRVRMITAAADANMIEVIVEDTGPGLSEESREKVFEPFFTTKPDGMGIGLALSRSIVDAHGGRLWADAAAQGGARFHVLLPAAVEDSHGDD